MDAKHCQVNSKILAMSWTNDGLHIALGLFSGPGPQGRCERSQALTFGKGINTFTFIPAFPYSFGVSRQNIVRSSISRTGVIPSRRNFLLVKTRCFGMYSESGCMHLRKSLVVCFHGGKIRFRLVPSTMYEVPQRKQVCIVRVLAPHSFQKKPIENGQCLKRTMVEKNGESSPRLIIKLLPLGHCSLGAGGWGR